MKKTYYKESNGYIEMSTTNPNVAKRNGCTLTTTEEIVMQGDGSGYVLASQYVASEQHYSPSLEERVEANEEAILSLMEVLSNG